MTGTQRRPSRAQGASCWRRYFNPDLREEQRGRETVTALQQREPRVTGLGGTGNPPKDSGLHPREPPPEGSKQREGDPGSRGRGCGSDRGLTQELRGSHLSPTWRRQGGV